MYAIQQAKNQLTEMVFRKEEARRWRDAQALRDEAIRRTQDMISPWKMSSQGDEGEEQEATPYTCAASHVQMDDPNDPNKPWAWPCNSSGAPKLPTTTVVMGAG